MFYNNLNGKKRIRKIIDTHIEKPISTTYSLCYILETNIILLISYTPIFWGFPNSSVGKESTCNAGDPGCFLGWEEPLEKGKATHSSIWPGEFHGLYNPWGHKELDTTEQLSLSYVYIPCIFLN